MNIFSETLDKIRRMESEAKLKEISYYMERYKFSRLDLEKGEWKIEEDGSMGEIKLKLYKLVETTDIITEGMVRPKIEREEHE